MGGRRDAPTGLRPWLQAACPTAGSSPRNGSYGVELNALLAIAIVVCAALRPAPAAGESAIHQAYRRAERFGSGAMNRLVFKAGVNAHWIGGSGKFWYRNITNEGGEFVLVDAGRGRRELALDHGRLAHALSQILGRPCDPNQLPFDTIAFDDDGQSVLFEIDGVWRRCDLSTFECGQAVNPKPAGAEKQKPQPGPNELLRRPESPDGQRVASVKDHNLYVKAKATGQETRLTEDGRERSRYGAFSWSPDSKKLVAYRTIPGGNLDMYAIESAPKDQLRPKVHSYVYALPGDKVATHEMWIFDLANREPMKVKTETVDWGGPPRLRWRSDNRRFLFEQTHRGFQRRRIIEIDSETGQARTIIDERSKTFLPPMKRFVHYVDCGHEFIWASERDGWNHLHLCDGETGQVKNQITKGQWVVHGVERVDEQTRQIYFTAGGREPGHDPYLIHHYRVNFDGSSLTAVTAGNGTHKIAYSPDGKYLIDTYSRVDLAPVTELRRALDGALVCELERADATQLLATGWRRPEAFCARGRDGETDIWGVIYRPSNLDESKKYPVIECIYAGPQGSSVPTTFAANRGQQALAELGFIVVQIDGMGMSHRSKAFHDVAHKNLADSGFPDRIAWMRAAAKRYPYLDLTRVGIYGHSAGGYNAARALIAHPEFYKLAVSSAGNHDHRTDKTWWNELWMGYPVDDHYREQSNVTNAHKLQGKLLLMHGELDRNVNAYASTMQFADALIKANKDFDLLLLPGQGHGFTGTYAKRRRWDYFVRNLLGIEPPKEFRFKTPRRSGASCHIMIHNRLDTPVSIHWVDFGGRLKRYHVLKAGQSIRQHTYVGHEWEAHVGGMTVSRYMASEEEPEWSITENGTGR